jgi:hypothetical protein
LESPVAQSELPTVTGTDLSEQEALDPEAIPSATPRDKRQETSNSSVTNVASQPYQTLITSTSFYAKPQEKEKRKPL